MTVTCKNPSSTGRRGKVSLAAVHRGNGARSPPRGPTAAEPDEIFVEK